MNKQIPEAQQHARREPRARTYTICRRCMQRVPVIMDRIGAHVRRSATSPQFVACKGSNRPVKLQPVKVLAQQLAQRMDLTKLPPEIKQYLREQSVKEAA